MLDAALAGALLAGTPAVVAPGRGDLIGRVEQLAGVLVGRMAMEGADLSRLGPLPRRG